MSGVSKERVTLWSGCIGQKALAGFLGQRPKPLLGAVVFLADLLKGFHSCTVIVKKTVDSLIASQWIKCFGNIGNRVQNHVILPVEFRVLRTAFEP